MALAAVLRAFRLDAQSLWIDEVFTWGNAAIRGPLPLAEVLDDIHGPLFSVLLHGWGALAGDGEWALRLPAAVFGVALVPVVAGLAGAWLGRQCAVPAAWLTAASPFLIWYSQEARNYSLLLLCAAGASWLLLALRQRPTPGRAAAYVAVAGAGLLTNLSFALLLPVHLVGWLAARGWRRRSLIQAAAALAVLFTVLLPWTAEIARSWDWTRLRPLRDVPTTEAPLRGATTFHPGAVPFAMYSFAVGYTLGPPVRELRRGATLAAVRRHAPAIVATGVVFGALAVAAFGALRRRRRLGEAALWILLPMLLVSYLALQNFKVFHPRYLAVVVPAIVAVTAAGLAALSPGRRRLAVAGVALLWTVALGQHYFDPRYAREDMRGAAALLRERAVAGERLLAVNTADLLRYYYRGPVPIEEFWLGHAAQPARMAERLDAVVAGAPATWLVLSRAEDLDPHGRFARHVDRRFPDAERHAFEGVRMWRVTPAPAVAGR